MKTFVWLIGKPGAGKTTVGDGLASLKQARHFAYSDLLKQVQPNPPATGYEDSDRDKVNQMIVEASNDVDVVLVSGNPYSSVGFGFLEQIRSHFSKILVIHLVISDGVTYQRLLARNREVLVHDGKNELDRVANFNDNLLPLINTYKIKNEIIEIDVTDMTKAQVITAVSQLIW